MPFLAYVVKEPSTHTSIVLQCHSNNATNALRDDDHDDHPFFGLSRMEWV